MERGCDLGGYFLLSPACAREPDHALETHLFVFTSSLLSACRTLNIQHFEQVRHQSALTVARWVMYPPSKKMNAGSDFQRFRVLSSETVTHGYRQEKRRSLEHTVRVHT